ncbi:mannosyltransferase [Pseudomonas sp. 250J]|uniref:dermonecrotic toxin domain-containing protein n=1 Tax=Pseudomonas TaxID=286 RepID=UPI0006814A9E|nr:MULTISPECIES: DUF6543 domain-containing protein [Pseudomonas]KNX76856.1 mannosyltransferase [Pseudomonas sp. 250J]MCU7281499.1 glycosyltransferase [Pseudomonas peradeniyensis]QZA55939.1 mannosyltransferase [Pseudomonas sp. 2hn]
MASTFVNNAGEQFIRRHLQNIPSPNLYAAKAIREWAEQEQHQLDPDQTDVVTLHYRGNQAVVTQRLSLTQAVLSNWQGENNKDLIGQLFPGNWAGTLPDGPLTIVEHLPEPGPFDNSARFSVFNGIFSRSTPARYDSTTHLPVDVEAMQQFIWNLDLHARFVTMLDEYWQKTSKTHPQSLQISFIAACNKQVQEGSLSDAGRQLAWQAAGLMPSASGLEIRPLNVYGYAATDIIQIADPAHPQVLLYLPGNSSPFHEFDGMNALKDWFAEQCRDSEKRQRLRQYFKLADTPDGLDFSGLDTALDGLGTYPRFHTRSPNRPGFTVDGPWPPRDYVNYKAHKYSPLIEGDLFEALTLRQRKRSYADADFLITSKTQVTKARWRDYLVTSINLLAPLALVVPELIPLLAVGGIAQFGLGIDQAINGKTPEDKAGGVSNIEFGLLNAAPLPLLLATRPQILFPGKNWRFVTPTRVNDQLGYSLSPMDPPRLPEEDPARYFPRPSFPLPTVSAGDSPVAQWVNRVIDGETGATRLEAVLDERKVVVRYDSEHDAFILESDAENRQPTFYQVTPQSNGLVAMEDTNRLVTNQMRMKTLRALGVDLQLPIEIPAVNGADLKALPKTIISIWVGDKVIPEDLLKTVGTNVERLRGTSYRYRMYLSMENPQAFAINETNLAKYSDKLEILKLEDEQPFEDFKDTEYYTQYQKAIEMKHFASACDVLRYPLLNAEGGIYMDVDDTLQSATHNLDTKALIGSTTLRTTPEGLVLSAPMSNDLMGMHLEYGTSIIGSHADNYTLERISEVMRERFLDKPDFYESRPLKGEVGYEDYVKELSRMTGPRVLNDVIDDVDNEELSRLRILRQIAKLRSTPQRNFRFLMAEPFGAIDAAEKSDQALSALVEIGNAHSWGKA